MLAPYQRIIQNLDALDQFTKELVLNFKPGDYVFLSGPLGSGKTTFVKSICAHLNIKRVTSPTFSIVNQYFGDIPVLHLDLYRLDSKKALLDFDIEYYLKQHEYLFFIEWAEYLHHLKPTTYYHLHLDYYETTYRKISITSKGHCLDFFKQSQSS